MRAHIALGASAPARASQEGARTPTSRPTAANVDAVRAAILCLHNQIRAERGLPLLKENARLRRAALGHSSDMVSRGFFEHTTPNGMTMVAAHHGHPLRLAALRLGAGREPRLGHRQRWPRRGRS